MAEVKMTFDGVPFTVADATAEAVVNKIVKARDAAVTAKEAAETSVATLTATVATKDAEITALKQAVEDAKITPAKLQDAAKAFAKTVADAKRAAPDLKLADDADADAIKAAVVAHKLGGAAKGWTGAQNDVAFATLVASLGDASDDDGIQRVVKDGLSRNDGDAATMADKAFDKANADFNAWRNEGKGAAN